MSQVNPRFIAIGIILTGTLIFVSSIGFMLLKPEVESANQAALPDQVAGLRKTSTSSGKQALSEITQLHGKEFALVSGAVGRYGADNQVTIWVAEAAGKTVAEEILLAMHNRIAEGNSPFIPIGEMQGGNHKIFTVDGLGQIHFYFQPGKLIIWMAADAHLAEEALQQILDYYP